jgi:ABC-2 type transport system ATP-binding protein
MTLELDHVGIGDEPGAPLPVVSAVAAPGRPGVIAVETEQAPVLASLVAGGRMQPGTGRVLLDGHEDAAAIRKAFALVDTPGIAEPFPVMTVRRIVREELAFAEQRPSREHVDTVLESLGIAHYADTHVQRVPTDVRVRLLVELALLRDGVTGVVITSPERHGGAVEDWFAVVRDVARRGTTVVLVTSKAAAATVEHLLDTVEPTATTQTEGPEDVARPDGDDPRLQSDTDHLPTEATA